MNLYKTARTTPRISPDAPYLPAAVGACKATAEAGEYEKIVSEFFGRPSTSEQGKPLCVGFVVGWGRRGGPAACETRRPAPRLSVL